MQNSLIHLGRVEKTVLFSNVSSAQARETALARHDGAGMVEIAASFSGPVSKWRQAYGAKYKTVIACVRESASEAFDTAREANVDEVEIVTDTGERIAAYSVARADSLERFLPDVGFAENPVEAQERAERAARAALPLIPVRYGIDEVVTRLVTANAQIDEQWIAEYLQRALGKAQGRAREAASILPTVDGVERISTALDDTLLARVRQCPGVYVVNKKTGGGKTRFARELLKQSKAAGQQPIYVSKLRSIVSGMSDLLPHYQAERVGQTVPAPGEEAALEGLAVTGNSLNAWRYRELVARSQVLIIDEAQQVLEHLATADDIEDRDEVLDFLGEAIGNTDTVLLCDADANATLIDFIKRHRPEETITVVEGKSGFSHITAQLGDYDQVLEEAIEAASAGRRVRVCIDSANEARAIAHRLQANGVTSCLAVTRRNVDDSAPAALIADPDMAIKQWSVLIHSPAIVSSVSITESHFDVSVGLFSGVVTATDALQMLRRDRTASAYRIGVRRPTRYRADNAQSILNTLLPRDARPSDNEALIASIRAEQNFARNHIGLALWAIMAAQGIAVTRIARDEQRIRSGRQAGRDGRRLVRKEYDRALLAARPATDSEAAEMLSGGGEARADLFFKMERRRAEDYLGVSDLERTHVSLWACGRLPSWVEAWRIATMKEAALKAANQAEKGNRVTCKHVAMRHEIYRYLLDALGWDIDGDPEEMVLYRDKAGPVLSGLVRQHFAQIQALDLPITITRAHEHARSPLPTLRRILESLFGLSFRDCEVVINGRRHRAKRVDEERLEQLRAVLAYRQRMTKSAPSPRPAIDRRVAVNMPTAASGLPDAAEGTPLEPDFVARFREPALDSLWARFDRREQPAQLAETPCDIPMDTLLV